MPVERRSSPPPGGEGLHPIYRMVEMGKAIVDFADDVMIGGIRDWTDPNTRAVHIPLPRMPRFRHHG